MTQMPQAETVNFRHNVGELCKERGEVQRIADKAEITRVYLSKLIHGHATPSIEVASKIAEALGVPLADLLASPRRSKKMAAAS